MHNVQKHTKKKNEIRRRELNATFIHLTYPKSGNLFAAAFIVLVSVVFKAPQLDFIGKRKLMANRSMMRQFYCGTRTRVVRYDVYPNAKEIRCKANGIQ